MRPMDAGGAYTRGTQLIKVCGITNSDDALVARLVTRAANLIGRYICTSIETVCDHGTSQGCGEERSTSNT
jgi:hypothetical protein